MLGRWGSGILASGKLLHLLLKVMGANLPDGGGFGQLPVLRGEPLNQRRQGGDSRG